MTLNKIVGVKNVGRLKNSAAGGDTTFKKHTLIFGANGFGKTTLCSIFRSLKENDGSYIAGRKTLGAANDPSVEILIGANNHRFNAGVWTNGHPHFAIYDGAFIAENVHSGDVVDTDQKRNLYRVIVGAAGVALAEQESTLAAEARAKTGEITSTLKAITSHVPAGIKVGDFIALPNVADVDGDIAKQEAKLTTLREAATIKTKAALTPLSLPVLPAGIPELLAKTIDGIATDAEKTVADHLSQHGLDEGGSNWVIHGLDHTDTTCPFCSQDVEGSSLIAAYRAVFSDGYKGLRNDIEAMRQRVETAFGAAAVAKHEAFAAQQSSSIEYWARYCTLNASTLACPAGIDVAINNLHAASQSLLANKAIYPLDAIAADQAFLKAMAEYEAAKTKVDAYNQLIRDANVLIDAKKTEAGTGDVASAQNELNRLKAVKARHAVAVAQLCTDLARLQTEKEQLEARKTAIREQLNQYTEGVVQPYENRINELLEDFNAGFRIAATRHNYAGGVATSSYQLVINQTAIDIGDGETPDDTPCFKNTLSGGDRSVLSLAFFMAHLESDPELANKVVVLDDPFNSQDAFRRRQTIQEILKIAGRCAQMVVLSHDAMFLKQIWDKCTPAERAAIQLSDHGRDGSKISAVDLTAACRGRTATDQDDLQAFVTRGVGQHLDIIRKMRTVLETYMRTCFSSDFLPNDNLGGIVGKIRAGGDAHSAKHLFDKLDVINDYTVQYHHGEDHTDATPELIDATELAGYARKTLNIVKGFQG